MHNIQSIKVSNKRLTEEEFLKIRKEEVLPMWETGKEIENLDQCVEYAKQMPESKNMALQLVKAKEEKRFIAISHFGRATVDFMTEGIEYTEGNTGADAGNHNWFIEGDTYTRKCKYTEAAKGLERSKKDGVSYLNGWPVVCYGVKEARRLNETAKSPLSYNGSDEDARLATEIILAGGWTGTSAHALENGIAHTKDVPLENLIRYTQYKARLAAYYTERGVPINVQNGCPGTGYDSNGYTSFAVVSESLLDAEQGVKYEHLVLPPSLNMIQDIAAMRVTERLAAEYCHKAGYKDIHFICGAYPYIGPWPQDSHAAGAMICQNAISCILGNITGFLLKSIEEAWGLPTKEGVATSLHYVFQLLRVMGTQRMPESKELEIEEKMLELEVRSLMERVLDLGDGDIAKGLCMGVEMGLVDTMVTPWKYNKGNVLNIRDAEGCTRYLEKGNLPLPEEVVEFHRQKIAEREKREKRKADIKMVIDDMTFVSRA
ncbi:MAG: hypothetical protein SV062_01860 [Thermodesulfobacteriota bacterium]|nr:hypothetical protein [Thermodesulfobacteriota bacterium]